VDVDVEVDTEPCEVTGPHRLKAALNRDADARWFFDE
jgi:hypothetical protein